MAPHLRNAPDLVTLPEFPKMVRILTFSSSASATPESAGNVIVSGSYGGEYNAFHAAKWKIRGVVLNDAGVGRGHDGHGPAGLDLCLAR